MDLGCRMLFVAISSLLISGCMFFGLREDVKDLNAATTISGTITTTSPRNKPILVALYRPEGSEGRSKPQLVTYAVMYGPGEFEFLRARGDYYLFAFEDANEDLTFQPEEEVGWYPALIEARPGINFTNLEIRLRPPDEAKQQLPSLYAPTVKHVPFKEDKSQLGQIVALDDPRFSPDVGPLGMWEPVKFYQQGHGGIFFLEPYRPDKIPVLLIHGISGSGYDWRHLLKQIDRNQFQPWVVQYASGLRLGLLSEFLNQAVIKLQATYKFKTLFVVAHSMGGLVARGFINHNVAQNDQGVIQLFVTISTPWQGHTAARTGVANAPVVVPSWYDMVPGSPYLASLFEHRLPDHIPYYLIFSHRGSRGLLSKANSDGTVTLRSQLSQVAQDRATKVFGYDEGHVSILQSAAVVDKLSEIMMARSTRLR